MEKWPRYPTLFEIHTWAWLSDLSRKYGRTVTLATVPDPEWNAIAVLGFDAVWLMGVWDRSPAGIAVSNRDQALVETFRRALPDFRPSDNVGSPYCVRRYVVDPHLGGPDGLAAARRELAGRGIRLILDFVPNHVAADHPWVAAHHGYFIQGTPADLVENPRSFINVDGRIFACGRDPYFPAWEDVVQVNAFDAGLRQAAIETLRDIAGQCDGVRCDMAMLLLNSVFERTWGRRAGPRPRAEYWDEVISAVQRAGSGFLFFAEAYWDLEWELQQLGFDFCYDKRLYDRLSHDNAESIRLHLCAGLDYQGRLLRFLENHDEPRAAAAFSPARERAAAVVTYTLPGARLFHEGQFEGRKVRLPVFLARHPAEPVDQELRAFYRKLLAAIDGPLFREGSWSLCERTGWPDNPSYQNILAWTWTGSGNRSLIVVNLSDRSAQARIHFGQPDFSGRTLDLTDRLSSVRYRRAGDEILSSGLFVDLPPWGCHFLDCRMQPVAEALTALRA